MEWFSRSHRRLAYVVSQVVGHGTGIVFPIIVYFNRDGVHGNIFDRYFKLQSVQTTDV